MVTFSNTSSSEDGELVFIHEGSTIGAIRDTHVGPFALDSLCSGAPALGPDVWFYFKPTEDGILQVDTCNSTLTSFDTLLAIFLLDSNTTATTSSDDNGGMIECTRNSVFSSNLFQAVQANLTYMVRLNGFQSTSSGHYVIRFGFTPGNFTSGNN